MRSTAMARCHVLPQKCHTPRNRRDDELHRKRVNRGHEKVWVVSARGIEPRTGGLRDDEEPEEKP